MSALSQYLLGILGVMVVIAVGVVTVYLVRKSVTEGGGAKGVDAIRAATGPSRCMLLLEHFNALAAKGNQGVIMRDWEAVEMLLLEAIPDCPPGLKAPMVTALDALHGQITNRSYQRRIMGARNSLV